jgi:hypothetical protein
MWAFIPIVKVINNFANCKKKRNNETKENNMID